MRDRAPEHFCKLCWEYVAHNVKPAPAAEGGLQIKGTWLHRRARRVGAGSRGSGTLGAAATSGCMAALITAASINLQQQLNGGAATQPQLLAPH